MEPSPITDDECTALCRQPPKLLKQGEVGNLRWWLTKYEKFPHPLLGVWATADFVFKSQNVWFPNATPRAVREWVEALEQPKPVPVKKVKLAEVADIAA